MHLTHREVRDKLLSYSEGLQIHYELYQLLLFHFQEKNANHFYRDKIINALKLPYSNAKLEATNNLIKIIKRKAFGFRNFNNFKKRILMTLNIKKESTNFVLSRLQLFDYPLHLTKSHSLFHGIKGKTWFGIEVPACEVFFVPLADAGIGNHTCIVSAESQRGDDNLDICDFGC